MVSLNDESLEDLSPTKQPSLPNTARNQPTAMLDSDRRSLPELQVSPRNHDLTDNVGTPKFNNQGFEFGLPYTHKEQVKKPRTRDFYALENYRSESCNYQDSKAFSNNLGLGSNARQRVIKNLDCKVKQTKEHSIFSSTDSLAFHRVNTQRHLQGHRPSASQLSNDSFYANATSGFTGFNVNDTVVRVTSSDEDEPEPLNAQSPYAKDNYINIHLGRLEPQRDFSDFMRVQQTDSFYSPEQNRPARESSALRKQPRRNNQSFNPCQAVYSDVQADDEMQAQF